MAGTIAVGDGARRPRAPRCRRSFSALLFFDPLLSFLPNDIDHHNAQLALLVRGARGWLCGYGERPSFGPCRRSRCALMLAIGLEMLPYVAVLGACSRCAGR